MKDWSQSDVHSAAARHVETAAKEDLTAFTTRCISVNTEARVTGPMEPPDQAKSMMRYMIAVQGGV